MDTMQRIISKNQHSDGLIGLWPQNQMLETVSYDFSKYQRHGTHVNATNRYRMARSYGHYMNMTGYNLKSGSYTEICSGGFANDNEISNPGFEDLGAGGTDFFDDWYAQDGGDGTIEQDLAVFRSGAASAKLSRGTNPCWVRATNFSVSAGEVWEVQYWAYGDGVNESQHAVLPLTGDDIVLLEGNGVTAAAWTKVSFEFTVPDNVTVARFYLHAPAVNGAFAYFDDVDIRGPGGFKGSAGTVIAAAQVDELGIWTDGIDHTVIQIAADVNNVIHLRKVAADNTFAFLYNAGGTAEVQLTAGLTSVGLVVYGMTWDISAGANGEVRYYIDGIASGATDTALGTWIGDLDDTLTLIGASSTVPTTVWAGGIGLNAIYNIAKPPAEMLYLCTP